MLSVCDYERYAAGKLDSAVEAYYYHGSSNMQTLHDNVTAFARYRFRPRVFRDVSKIDMSTTVLGQPVSCPVGVAPMALCSMAHTDAELGIARACERLQLPFCLSTNSSTSIEDVAAGAPNSARWFHLYIFKGGLTELLVRRAEDAGYSALVLTVDGVVGGRRLTAMREGFTMPEYQRLVNFDSSNSKREFDTTVTWNDLKWFTSITRLPLILKGILTGEDAREAVSRGVAAVWVSNHGGRQLDGVPATLDVLSEVVDAVEGRCEVYLDGGVRSGYDVTKALALGARAVFIGRPALWGLVYKGTEGVVSLLQLVKEEMANAMALLGVRHISEINRDYVVHESRLPKL